MLCHETCTIKHISPTRERLSTFSTVVWTRAVEQCSMNNILPGTGQGNFINDREDYMRRVLYRYNYFDEGRQSAKGCDVKAFKLMKLCRRGE